MHEFPSLQAVPSAFPGLEQTPVAGLHTPAVWHWSLAEQTIGLLPTQVPAWQVSDWVHEFPSLQLAPSAFTGFVHAPVAEPHTPAV